MKSGTSMATPIATGVIARRLAGNPVLDLSRDAVRAAAIVKLATDHAQDKEKVTCAGCHRAVISTSTVCVYRGTPVRPRNVFAGT